MPKLKTVKGVKDRIRITRTGKLLAHRAGRRHLLGAKRGKAKRHMRRLRAVPENQLKNARTLLPYT